jgi:hypothetical protein
MIAVTIEEAAQPQVQSRATPYSNSLRYTNFYPLYNGANDQVDPVLRVQPVQFQRVLPRYRLSTSETRDLGVGPMFTEVPSISLRRNQDIEISGEDRSVSATGAAAAGQLRGRAAELEPWKGSQVDLFA